MASRTVTRHYDRALAASGLSTNEYAILSRLAGEGDAALGTLAARLAMDRSTLSRDLAPLVTSGLVALGNDPADGRRRVASLTPAGNARVNEARPLWAAAQAGVVGEFGLERTDGLVRELQALVGAA
jgi:DNA-binding MarR family transcriptional regulator